MSTTTHAPKERAGGQGRFDPRRGWLLPLSLYVAAFVVFLPSAHAVTASDEASYLGQARLFASFEIEQTFGEPLTRRQERRVVSDYPVGTSLLIAPFVGVGGLSAGRVPIVLCLVAAVSIVASWLARRGADPRLALLVFSFPPALVLGRVAMSDVPSLLLAAAFFALIDEDDARARGWAGLIAGLSLTFRETNVLPMVPFVVGVLWRKERGWQWMIAAGALGTALRLLASFLAFGDALYARGAYAFTLDAIPQTLPLYVFALLVLAPGGLVVTLAYRGPRRAELVTAVLGSLAFFLVYSYSGSESGLVRRLIVGPRYFVTILPLLAVAWGDVLERAPARWAGAQEWGLRGLVGLACVAAVAVHPVLWSWGLSQERIVSLLFEATSPARPVLTQPSSTSKYLAPVFGPRIVADFESLPAHDVPTAVRVHGGADVAYVERSDSEYHRGRVQMVERYVSDLAALGCRVEEVVDERVSDVERVHVFAIGPCSTPD